ncbi:hypothetical protein RHMOL_Rhmol06G0046200 [Rhododendron molle]|uniref:Uncharacterized protein n=1 Tax=Rhododendron molle TaxID=49168 RepID=A0ACC0N9Z6_RHOML|nr:hypothetical protein RHMOL_Rhmol06G0046200 [Rhododendron molle]
MRFGPKKGWLHFCMFPRVKPDTDDAGDTPVYLNVYDLTPVNGYIYWAGFGIFHSGVEVHGAEYAFGAHDSPSSGVFEVEPRQCPGFKFRKSVLIGTTCLDALEVREFMEYHSSNYYGNTYSLIAKNCNHFCKDVCYRLTRKPIPKWVNRLAEIGSSFHCVLPESFNDSVSQRNPSSDEECSSDKRKLKSSFSCLSSVSIRQTQLSRSSLFLRSPLKGCSPLWGKIKSKHGLLTER